jgi:hypothetical protein
MRVRNRRKFTPEVGNTKCRSKVKVKAKGKHRGRVENPRISTSATNYQRALGRAARRQPSEEV